MTFINGTITNANPGPALYAVIETAMLADGWTLVDTVVIGANTHKVLKSAAAGNVQNLDWYLDINYPTTGTSGGIRFAAFEGYDAGTHLAVNGPYVTFSSAIDPVTYSRYGTAGFALETNWSNTASIAGLSNTLSAASFNYWISVTRNRIIVMLSTQTSNIHYAGFFAPTAAHAANAGSALFPLVTAKMASTSSSTSPSAGSSSTSTLLSLSRIPKMPAGSFAWSSSGGSAWSTPFAALLGAGVAGLDGMSPSPLTGQTTLAPISILGGANALGVSSTIPSAFIGTLMDMGGATVTTSASRGDSVTVGTDTWYMCTHASQFTLLFKAV